MHACFCSSCQAYIDGVAGSRRSCHFLDSCLVFPSIIHETSANLFWELRCFSLQSETRSNIRDDCRMFSPHYFSLAQQEDKRHTESNCTLPSTCYHDCSSHIRYTVNLNLLTPWYKISFPLTMRWLTCSF